MRSAVSAVVAAGLLCGASAFTTTLHGGANEDTPVGTPGAAALTLQPWLTEIDADVRPHPAGAPAHARPAHPRRSYWPSAAPLWV
jgi:hypothetical protein